MSAQLCHARMGCVDDLHENVRHRPMASKPRYCAPSHTRWSPMPDAYADGRMQRAAMSRRLCRRRLGQLRRVLCNLRQRVEDPLPGHRARGFPRREKLRRALRAPLVLQRPVPSAGGSLAHASGLQGERLGRLHEVLSAMRHWPLATRARCDSESVKRRRRVRPSQPEHCMQRT